jgi:hypothetical protein
MSQFQIGTRVQITMPVGPTFTATITRVIAADGNMGGLFTVRADDGRKFRKGADWFAGEWMRPIGADVAVLAHPLALVAIGGGN